MDDFHKKMVFKYVKPVVFGTLNGDPGPIISDIP